MTMALTKADIVSKVARELEVQLHVARELVDTFFEDIKDSLQKGNSVKISGFGNFETRDKAARPGRNPKTGEIVPIEARRVVTFKPGQKLKMIVSD
jgi:integration host factor subunit alpha